MSKELKGIEQPPKHATLWRYMSFEKFINILATESLFFSRADRYDDKSEGHIPEAMMRYYGSVDIRINPSFREYIMCNCWHHGEEESMGMWDKYHVRDSGVSIKTTMGNVKNCLPDTPNIFIGKVDYDVEAVENQSQIEVPKDLSIENLLHYLYFYKKKSFEYEQEVRAIIDITSIPRDDPYKFGVSLKIDVKTLIGKDSEIIVSPHAGEWITETVASIVKRCGLQCPVNRSELLDRPS